MAYRFFVIPIRSPFEAEEELNDFMASHRVLSVDRRWLDRGEDSCWAFCVDYLRSTGGSGKADIKARAGSRDRVDYREKLSPADFEVFVKLRTLRKEIAQAEAIPVYAVFTNEQLARMVVGRVTTKTALEGIAGVGDARVEKYGSRIVDCLANQWKEPATDATSQPPV